MEITGAFNEAWTNDWLPVRCLTT